jgi:hypothetical protein
VYLLSVSLLFFIPLSIHSFVLEPFPLLGTFLFLWLGWVLLMVCIFFVFLYVFLYVFLSASSSFHPLILLLSFSHPSPILLPSFFRPSPVLLPSFSRPSPVLLPSFSRPSPVLLPSFSLLPYFLSTHPLSLLMLFPFLYSIQFVLR